MPLHVVLSFPNKEGPGADRGYELIPITVHSTGILHLWYWLFSGGNQFCLPTSPFRHCWATQLYSVPSSIFGQMWLGDTLYSVWVCESALCPREDKPAFLADKPTCLMIEIKRYALRQTPCLESATDLILQMSKTAG